MRKANRDEERLRSLAVALVDCEHGFTMEFAPSPEAHRHEYDDMERRLRACMQTNRVRLIAANT